MNSYYIKLDGQVMDMLPGQSVTLERYNPIFDFETIRGAKVLDFTLPFSPKNDAFFNFAGLHQSRLDVKKFYCEKYAEGILFERGYVELLDVTDSGYQVFFTQNLGNFFGDYQNTLMNLIDFGSENINLQVDFDYLTDSVAFPSIINRSFFADNVKAGFNGIVNEVSGGNFVVASPKVPMLSLKTVFDKISGLCNVTFSGNFFLTEWYQRGLLDNTFALDGATTILLQNHLPRLTIPDFLKEFAKLLNVAIYIDPVARIVRMKMRDEQMQQATRIDLTGKVTPGNSRTPLRTKRLELDWELDGDDNLMKTVAADFLKYQTAGNQDEFFTIKSRFSTRLKDATTGLAICEQVGISSEFKQQGNSFTPKLLLWNGVVNGVPTATNEFGNYRLAWHGAKNLVSSNFSFLEQWRERTSARPVTARLSPADLAMLDYHRSGGDDSIVHVHGRDYYIESIRVNLPISGQSSLELWEK